MIPVIHILVLSILCWSGFAADMGYATKTISVESKDEVLVSDVYDSFLTLLSVREIKAGEIKYPVQMAERRESGIIVTLSFYVSTNDLRGFELFIPNDCLVEKEGNFVSTAALMIERDETKQGVRCLVLKRKS
jgi:hypothetical protein